MSNPNDPAYPLDDGVKPCYGLTIRQEFVKAAMQGILIKGEYHEHRGDGQRLIARYATQLADATLAEEARTRSKA